MSKDTIIGLFTDLLTTYIIAANIKRIYWLYKLIGNKKIGQELLSKHAKLTSIWRFPPEGKNSHPAAFPLTLPLRAIYSVNDEEKGVIIDPYCR